MSAFYIKVIAVVAMFIDHLAAVFPEIFPFFFRGIGRISFPIFAYFIAEGFNHTKSPKNFLLRLGAFALISEPFYDWALQHGSTRWHVDFFANTNIFYTLFLGGLSIYLYQRIAAKVHPKLSFVGYAPMLLLCLVSIIFSTDYSIYGVILIFLLYVTVVFKELQGKKRIAMLAGAFLLPYVDYLNRIFNFSGANLSDWFMILGIATAIVLLMCYNGERGKPLKWVFYVVYPAHLAVLGIIAQMFFFP